MKPRLTLNEMKALYTASMMSAGTELTQNNCDIKMSEGKVHAIWENAMSKLNTMIKNKKQNKELK